MDLSLFLTYLAACGAAATTGAVFQPGEWYDGLTKPSWTPPRWVFPVAWTTLYLLISISAAWVAAKAGTVAGTGTALAFWSLQIALNTLWTPIFFGLKRMRAGFFVIILLWLAVVATMVSFFAVDFWAGVLMVPYAVWVTIASALNFSVWRLNLDNAA